jgi:hypothetical protein
MLGLSLIFNSQIDTVEQQQKTETIARTLANILPRTNISELQFSEMDKVSNKTQKQIEYTLKINLGRDSLTGLVVYSLFHAKDASEKLRKFKEQYGEAVVDDDLVKRNAACTKSLAHI